MKTKGELREEKREKKRKGMKMDGRSIKTLMANREATRLKEVDRFAK